MAVEPSQVADAVGEFLCNVYRLMLKSVAVKAGATVWFHKRDFHGSDDSMQPARQLACEGSQGGMGNALHTAGPGDAG